MLGRPKFVLASGSPRRLALLNQAGIEPDALRPADVDETPKRGELPRACANRLARAKADAALKSVRLDDELRGAFILAADTVVAVGRRILPKANLVDEASRPFCSERCRDVDLNRWLSNSYLIPATKDDDEDAD